VKYYNWPCGHNSKINADFVYFFQTKKENNKVKKKEIKKIV